MMFEAGSGEVLMPRRTPALRPWLTRAVPPPPTPASTSSVPTAWSNWANSTPIRLPIAGLITVCRTSQALSRNGTLSVTNSIAYSTAAAIRMLSPIRASGTSPNPTRPSRFNRTIVP